MQSYSELTRRRLLKGTLQGLALLAVPSSLGFSLFSEVLEPDEIRAYDALSRRLRGDAKMINRRAGALLRDRAEAGHRRLSDRGGRVFEGPAKRRRRGRRRWRNCRGSPETRSSPA